MTEQAEAGDVGGRADAGGQRRGRRGGVERRHGLDRLRKHLARGLVPVVEDADPQRLGQADRLAGAGRVNAQQPVRVGEPGHGEPVLRLRVVDAVAAGQVAAGRSRHVGPAPQDLGQQIDR